MTYSPKLGEQSFEEWQNEHKKVLDKSGESGIINKKISDRTVDFYMEGSSAFDMEKLIKY